MLCIDFSNPVIREDYINVDRLLSERSILKGKSIYISGASGMIASYLTGYFIWLNEKKRYNIRIFAGIRSKKKAYARFGNYVEKEYFNILSQDVVEQVQCEYRFDYIIHAASLASPQYYGSMPVETMLPNVIGTYNLLRKSMVDNIDGFLFISSGAVYGTLDGVEYVAENNVGTIDYIAKGNEYGESKRCGEALCMSYYREYGIPIRIARVHHTYGPTTNIESDSRVFAEFACDIIKRRNIVLKSKGDSCRAFCYISDTLVGLLTILIHGESGEAYNIANPDEFVSVLELANILIDTFCDRRLKIIHDVRCDEGYNSSPEKRLNSVNVDKLKALGWKHNVSIRDGFLRMVSAIEYDKD